METFNPHIIVCLSGKGWYFDFLCGVNNDTEPSVVATEKWDKYEAVVYKIGDRIFIGSEHPQGKPERAHVEAITKLIKKYM